MTKFALFSIFVVFLIFDTYAALFLASTVIIAFITFMHVMIFMSWTFPRLVSLEVRKISKVKSLMFIFVMSFFPTCYFAFINPMALTAFLSVFNSVVSIIFNSSRTIFDEKL